MRILVLLGAVLAIFLVDMLLAQIALRITGVPKGFPPFTALPILSGVVGGVLLATISYAVLRLVTPQAPRALFFVAIAVLALSFALPMRLSFTKSIRFAGITPAAQMFLNAHGCGYRGCDNPHSNSAVRGHNRRSCPRLIRS